MTKRKKVRQEPLTDDMDKSFADIDRDALDDEWLQQPGLYLEWADSLARAKLQLDEAKGALDLLKAELAKDIREDPGGFGLDRPTVGAVEETVIMQDEYQYQLSQVQQSTYLTQVMQAAVFACDHRKRALENLVTLHGQQYFSEPVARTDEAKDHVDTERKKRVRKKRT